MFNFEQEIVHTLGVDIIRSKEEDRTGAWQNNRSIRRIYLSSSVIRLSMDSYSSTTCSWPKLRKEQAFDPVDRWKNTYVCLKPRRCLSIESMYVFFCWSNVCINFSLCFPINVWRPRAWFFMSSWSLSKRTRTDRWAAHGVIEIDQRDNALRDWSLMVSNFVLHDSHSRLTSLLITLWCSSAHFTQITFSQWLHTINSARILHDWHLAKSGGRVVDCWRTEEGRSWLFIDGVERSEPDWSAFGSLAGCNGRNDVAVGIGVDEKAGERFEAEEDGRESNLDAFADERLWLFLNWATMLDKKPSRIHRFWNSSIESYWCSLWHLGQTRTSVSSSSWPEIQSKQNECEHGIYRRERQRWIAINMSKKEFNALLVEGRNSNSGRDHMSQVWHWSSLGTAGGILGWHWFGEKQSESSIEFYLHCCEAFIWQTSVIITSRERKENVLHCVSDLDEL